MKAAPVLTAGLGFLYAVSIDFFQGVGIEEMQLARVGGTLIAGLALLSMFAGSSGVRQINTGLCFALAISPMLAPSYHPSALVAQAVTGLIGLGLTMLPSAEEEGHHTGWREVFKRIGV